MKKLLIYLWEAFEKFLIIFNVFSWTLLYIMLNKRSLMSNTFDLANIQKTFLLLLFAMTISIFYGTKFI